MEDLPVGLKRSRHDPTLLRRTRAVAGPVAAQRRGRTDRGRELRDAPRTEREDVGRDARQVEVEVLLQPREAILERKHLVADDTAQEFDNRGRKRCAVERGMDTVLDALVELYDGVVHCVRRGVGEPKELVVHGRSGAIEPGVDGRCVRSTVDTDGTGDFVLDVLGKVTDDDIFRICKHMLKRLDERKLDERGSDTDGANEEAHEGWRVGSVCNKPRERVPGLWLQPENSRKEPRCTGAEALLELGIEGKNILVCELESGNGSPSRRRGIRPLFAYGVDSFLDLAESVPFDECIGDRDNHDEADEDECSGLSNVDERVADVIYNGSVDIIAELDRSHWWQWELSSVEG